MPVKSDPQVHSPSLEPTHLHTQWPYLPHCLPPSPVSTLDPESKSRSSFEADPGGREERPSAPPGSTFAGPGSYYYSNISLQIPNIAVTERKSPGLSVFNAQPDSGSAPTAVSGKSGEGRDNACKGLRQEIDELSKDSKVVVRPDYAEEFSHSALESAMFDLQTSNSQSSVFETIKSNPRRYVSFKPVNFYPQYPALLEPVKFDSQYSASLESAKFDSQGYCLGDCLDRGGYGIVASVIHRDKPNSLFARKQIPKRLIDYRDLQNEVQLIHQARHPHVIRVVEEYQDDKNFYIVMEPVAANNLHEYLQEMTSSGPQTLGWEAFGDRRLQLFRFMRCLAATVKEIHSRGIRHRDIKPDNILIQGQNIILTDFGTSFASEEATRAGFTRTWGTDKYEPPEAFDGQKGGPSRALKNRTGRSGDIFGLGCVFYEILEALSIQADFPRANDNYAAHVVDKTFVHQVCAVKEHNPLVSKRLRKRHRLPGIVERMLELVMRHMMVVPEERKDAAFVLEAVNRIYQDYPELRSGCCANEAYTAAFALSANPNLPTIKQQPTVEAHPSSPSIAAFGDTAQFTTNTPDPTQDSRDPSPVDPVSIEAWLQGIDLASKLTDSGQS